MFSFLLATFGTYRHLEHWAFEVLLQDGVLRHVVDRLPAQVVLPLFSRAEGAPRDGGVGLQVQLRIVSPDLCSV